MELKKGIKYQVIKATKFKDIGISIRFLSPLSREKATAKSVLAMLFCDYCEKYPSKQQMANHLDELYGMTLNATTYGYGKGQVLELRSKVIDPKYINDEIDLLKEQFAFLHEVLFHPYLEAGMFADRMVEEAKLILASKIQRMMDEPSQYCVTRALQLASDDSALSISALGTLEDLSKLTKEDLMLIYQSMIENDEIEIIVCGNVKEEQIKSLIDTYLRFSDTHQYHEHAYHVNISKPMRRIEESKKITQTYLMLLYQTNISIKDDRYWALKVANAMLGQYPSSLLFREVREKHSLCYSIFSNLISFDGALGITTGIQLSDIDKTLDLIHEQVALLQKGNFSDALFETSKELLCSAFKSSKDMMGSIMSQAYQNLLLDQDQTIEDVIASIQAVTKEAVVQVMNQIEEKLIYVLKEEEPYAIQEA